jgi:outer membrane protein OmpA-like peptidoglycan-associated protein
VALPGKGTFVLNEDRTVTFTPAKGFIGEATVQLRATDKYGQSSEAPITVRVSPVPGAQVGSTKGVTPIVLKPVRASLKSSEICLIDVADQGCKTVVKAPNVGTWRQAADGSVSFVAVAGYIGTTSVQQRVTESGASTFNPYTVTVAKKRGPVTITISGFADGSPVMTASIKAQVNAFLKAYADYRQVTCIGYTEGPTVLPTDIALSRQRALNACSFVKSGLGSKLLVNPVRAGQDTVEAAHLRRVTITLND